MRLRRSPARGRLARQGGFSLLEAYLCVGLLTMAAMGHIASTFSGHRLSRTVRSRSVALEFVNTFLERMQSDEAWATLYSRLRAKDAVVENGLPDAGLGVARDLEAIRCSISPTDYYSDLAVPEALGDANVLVQVPYENATLRESTVAPAFGLPHDLNGDGVIHTTSRAADYVALPVVVTLRWTPPGEPSQMIRVPTWMRGTR